MNTKIAPKISKSEYKIYKTMLREKEKEISEKLGTSFSIVPTSKKICRKVGLSEEAANCMTTADFLGSVYKLLKEKGYRLPKIYISEYHLPRESNLAGFQQGNYNIFGPGRLDVSSPSIVLHEEGHYLHKKNVFWAQPLYAMFCRVRNIFRPFLNKKEAQILSQDIKRAYKQGFYEDLQVEKCLKKGYIDEATLNDFYKTPEKFIIKNMLTNESEFVADYFSLAIRGFEFSPEITKRYKYFHGPEIKEIVTPAECEKLMEYKNKLENRIYFLC